jgi:hypothetical protein
MGRLYIYEPTEKNMKGHEVFLMELENINPFLKKDSIKSHDIRFIKRKLNSLPLFSSLIYKQRISGFQRVTINKRLFGGKDERIFEISLLKYPPPIYITRFGRMNFPYQSVLYATFDPITALSEMRPEPGDKITMSTWELISNNDLTISPVFKNTSKDGNTHSETSLRALLEYKKLLALHDDETAKQIDILIQFMADCFAKEVDGNNHFDYFMSAYFSNKILNVFENAQVDAILYPSVRQSLTLTNIALKPDIFDSNYKISLVEESVVSSIPARNGGWILEGTGYTKKFGGEKILWD